jgi:hypothetical protein
MSSTNRELSPTSARSDHIDKDNQNYTRNSNDIRLPTLKEEENTKIEHPLDSKSTSSSSLPAIYEIPMHNTKITMSGISNGLPEKTSSTSFTHQQHHRSGALGPNERNLSILDPMSDRVSTILVWQNLTVQVRENKRKEFFKRMKSYKDFVPTRKSLLSNTSGAIAGGLWAVMGKIFVTHGQIPF